MNDLGKRLGMVYGPTSSGAECDNTPGVFRQFGYNAANHVSYDVNGVRSDICQNRRPLLACGTSKTGVGHTWVVDGYLEQSGWQKSYTVFYDGNTPLYSLSNSPVKTSTTWNVHHNFGADGTDDAWIMYTDPSHPYKNNIRMVFGITPIR